MTFSRVVLARDIDLTPYESAMVSARVRRAEGGRDASIDVVALDVVGDWGPVDDSGAELGSVGCSLLDAPLVLSASGEHRLAELRGPLHERARIVVEGRGATLARVSVDLFGKVGRAPDEGGDRR